MAYSLAPFAQGGKFDGCFTFFDGGFPVSRPIAILGPFHSFVYPRRLEAVWTFRHHRDGSGLVAHRLQYQRMRRLVPRFILHWVVAVRAVFEVGAVCGLSVISGRKDSPNKRLLRTAVGRLSFSLRVFGFHTSLVGCRRAASFGTSSIPKAHELVGVIELAGLGFESAHVAADTDVVHKEADTPSLYFRAATAERTRFEGGVELWS